MRVSVVICTYNRAEGLRETLRSLRLQRHRDFEVVVVNGPSTDHTESVLAAFGDTIKVLHNPAANLSVSRNLGIGAAAGDLVAFIDDDALPEPAWLEQLLPAFDDDEVAGAGGIVLDHTGMRLQYRYSASNRFGEPTFSHRAPFDWYCVPGAFTFPYLQGTNAAFRRETLARIGLFDETYDFYLDETDLCCRLVDAGHVLRQLPDAPIHHKYLPSATRNSERVVTNWYPVVKNHVYFGYRHARDVASELDIIERARAFVERLLDDTRRHVATGRLPEDHLGAAIDACGRGFATGILLGRERRDARIPAAHLEPGEFLRYDTGAIDRPRRIALVSSGYPPTLTGGIARFVSDVAPELAGLGHEVRVFAASDGASTVDLENDVWVHRLAPASVPGLIPDGPPHVDRFATAVEHELERLMPWWQADVAYGSLWDVELLGIARALEVPVVPMLATPTAEVALHEGWHDPEHPNHETVQQLIGLERELVRRSCLVHAISDAIEHTFDDLYPGAFENTDVVVGHIGRRDDLADAALAPLPAEPHVLFVGRLEPRKGIDTFLDAAERLLARHAELRITVAGDSRREATPGESYPQLWDRRRPAGHDRLVFTGTVDDDELAHLIDAATAVVMPSRYESFGLVVVEAMMHARAAVASAVGGLVEVVRDGETGILVPVGDAAALAAAIDRLVVDPALAARMGTAGRERFVRTFTSRAAAERLATVLEAAIRRGAVHRGAAA